MIQELLRNNILSCTLCDLYKSCKKPVPGIGALEHAPIMAIGESTGYQDDLQGVLYPAKARVTQELEMYLQTNNLSRQLFYFTNVNKCKAHDDYDITDSQIEACRVHLDLELAVTKCEILALMGSTPCKILLGEDFDLEGKHGIPFYWEHNCRKFTVLPMFHPAYGLHKTNKMTQILEDFSILGKLLRREIKVEDFYDKIGDDVKYKVLLSSNVASFFRDNPTSLVSIDTETESDMQTPWSVQFSTRVGEGYFVFAQDRVGIEAIKEKLENPQVTTLMHNGKFDISILRNLGIHPAKVIDTMVGAYLLQNLPQGLKNGAYRLAGMRMTSFTDLTSEPTQKRFQAYMQEIIKHEWPLPPKELVWEKTPKMEDNYDVVYSPAKKKSKNRIKCSKCSGNHELGTDFCDRCENYGYVLIKSVKTGKTIVPGTENGYWREKQPQELNTRINKALNKYETTPEKIKLREYWYNNIDKVSRKLIQDKLGKLQSCDLRDIDFQTALTYSCKDPDATLRVWLEIEKRITEFNLWDTFHVDMEFLLMVIDMEEIGFKIKKEQFSDLAVYYDEQLKLIEKEVDEIAGYHIQISSTDQVAEFLYTKLGIKCPKQTKGGDDSTDKDTLKEIQDKHVVIPKILKWRGFQKNKTSFAETIPEMANPKTSRLHGTIKNTRTVTGRPSMAEPNLLQIPKRSKEGFKIRKGFIAEDGNFLISADYSQIELRVLAHEAKERKMIKCFQNNEDLHIFTASQVFGIPVSMIDKKIHREPTKTVNFGIPYGFTEDGLAESINSMTYDAWAADREAGRPQNSGLKLWTGDDAKAFMKEWHKLYPDISPYFETKRAQARRLGYVTDMFGRIYRVPQVRSTVKHIRAEGDRLAGNYPIQGGAAGIMKRAMRNLAPIYKIYRQQGKFCWPLLQIYDDMLSEAEIAIAYDFIKILRTTMEGAVKLLVPIKAEPSIGTVWGEMVDVNF